MAIATDLQGAFRLREVFSQSFNAFRRHAVAYIILSAIAHVPLFRFYYYSKSDSSIWDNVATYVVCFVCIIIAYGAIIYVVIQDLPGRRVSITEAITVATRRSLPLVGISAAVVVLIWLIPAWPGLEKILIVILGSWLVMVTYFLAAPVCIAEEAGVGPALSRCLFLTRERRWQIFVAILLIGIVSLASTVIVVLSISNPAESIIVAFSIWIVLGAFSAVMAAVFYDRLRLIKDGVHIAKVFDWAATKRSRAITEMVAIERAVVLFSLDDERRKRLAVNQRRWLATPVRRPWPKVRFALDLPLVTADQWSRYQRESIVDRTNAARQRRYINNLKAVAAQAQDITSLQQENAAVRKQIR
jgi:hypothetical protein